jgi:hypothetical protein
MHCNCDQCLARIFDRNFGNCHICGKQLAFRNYGARGLRGAWEIDHRVAKANGGSDDVRNLSPACIACNRSKGAKSTRTARAAASFAPSCGLSGQSGLPRGLSIAELNENERLVTEMIWAARRISLSEINRRVPSEWRARADETSWVRNALRRLVREGFVAKLDRGEYVPGYRAPVHAAA